MKKATRKITILQTLYETGLHLTAADFNISNANQFLGQLESQELVKRYWVREEGIKPFKLAYVSNENMTKAKKYLEALQGKKPKQDEVQESRN